MHRTADRRVPTRQASAVLAAALLLMLFATDEAAASKIVYTCAPELCVADPDSGASSRLTTDGAASAYRYPSLSRDGTRLAAARGGRDVMVGPYGGNLTELVAGTRDMNDVAISPDGTGVGESHSYVENRYGCPLTGGCLELVDRSATFHTAIGVPDGTRSHPGGGGVGYLGNGALLSSRYILAGDTNQICVVAAPATPDVPCEPRVISTATLSAPAGSPDSTRIAVGVGPALGLYDAATGAAVRQIAAVGADPAFSPDGRQIAYATPDGWIHVVPTSGGTARRLVQGMSPTWGDGFAPGPGVASTALRLRRGRIAVRVWCTGSETCRGTVRVTRKGRTLGSRGYRVAAGKSATVSVRPTARGRRTIARARKHAVRVSLRPRTGGVVTRQLNLRR